MRILLCNYEYPPLGGGGGVVMAALARELARRHTITVLTSRALGLPAESIEGDVRVLRVPVFFRRELAVANVASMSAYLPMAGLRALTLQRSGNFDVINTHFVVPTGPLGHLLGRVWRVPNVLSVHGGDLYDPSKRISPHRLAWLRKPICYLLARADALVGQSRNTLQNVEEIYGVRRPTHLIPLGISRPPPVARVPRRDFGIPDDAFLMVTVGRLVARKATVQLVQALAAAQRPAAHLLIVGDGPDAGAIQHAAAHAGLSDRVHLLGHVSEERKCQALSAADVFISASQHEGFGLVFLEAMAFGLPIICYDHGGQTDFLADGVTGHLVSLNDLDGLVRALLNVHDRAPVRAAMSEHNRRLVEDYFIDKCAARYETVFEEVARDFAVAHRGGH
ncbi:MAG: glycosyltransferase family 4 protein [Pseudomonadota bacterium]|nr:glycosyltransferase family 4 protein [Pseudomonadota bacterium]